MSISVTVRNGTAVGKGRSAAPAATRTFSWATPRAKRKFAAVTSAGTPGWCHFAVRDCSDYLSRLLPTLDEMEEMAFSIDLKKGNPRSGFGGATAIVSKSEEDSE
jgi:hypothetical protein